MLLYKKDSLDHDPSVEITRVAVNSYVYSSHLPGDALVLWVVPWTSKRAAWVGVWLDCLLSWCFSILRSINGFHFFAKETQHPKSVESHSGGGGEGELKQSS